MRHSFASCAALCALFLSAGQGWAQNSYGLNELSTERLNPAADIYPAAVDGAFGDQLSLYNGALRFNNVDVSIPGTGLPVELRRAFRVRDDRLEDGGNGDLGGMADWSLDIPSLSGVFEKARGWQVAGANPYARCSSKTAPDSVSGFIPSEFWYGYRLSVPEKVDEDLLVNTNVSRPAPTNGINYPWTTKSIWLVSCKAATKNGYPGEAFIATSPDGVKYHLDWVVKRSYPGLVGRQLNDLLTGNRKNLWISREKVYFLVSRVEDRFGNWVDYTYSGDLLTGMTSSDGRSISIAYSKAKVSSVSSPRGIFQYAYSSSAPTRLLTVTQPDGSRWEYASEGELKIEHDSDMVMQNPPCKADAFGGLDFIYKVNNPLGATGVFSLSVKRQLRQNAPELCVGWQEGAPSNPSTMRWIRYWQVPLFSDAYALTSKVVSGPGLAPLAWQYTYPNTGRPLGFEELCAQSGTCPLTKSVVVNGPGPKYERYTFGIWWGVNDGQLLAKEVGSSAASILSRQDFEYVSKQEAGNLAFGEYAGSQLNQFADPLENSNRPIKKITTTQDGVSFTYLVESYDAFSRPVRVTRSSSAGN